VVVAAAVRPAERRHTRWRFGRAGLDIRWVVAGGGSKKKAGLKVGGTAVCGWVAVQQPEPPETQAVAGASTWWAAMSLLRHLTSQSHGLLQ
jgi:hypothetical protein